MTLGSRTLGSNTLGGRRPVFMYNSDESGLTTIPVVIEITEHLNIKYRKILTNLWARQGRRSSHSLLLFDDDYAVTEDDAYIMISDSQFSRVVKQTSDWRKQDRNE